MTQPTDPNFKPANARSFERCRHSLPFHDGEGRGESGRPDVRQAKQLLRSSNADIGEAVAEFFPQIGLTAFLGKVSPELSACHAGQRQRLVSCGQRRRTAVSRRPPYRPTSAAQGRARRSPAALPIYRPYILSGRGQRAHLAREARGNPRAAGPPGQGPGRSRSCLHQELHRRPSQLLRSPRSLAAALSSRIESRARRTGSAPCDRPTLQGFGRWLGHGTIIPFDGHELFDVLKAMNL